MCLNISRTSFIAMFYIGIYLVVLLRDGICDDSSLSEGNSNRNKDTGNLAYQQHVHNWNGWEDWLPSSAEHSHNTEEGIPLSISEQEKLRQKRSASGKSYGNLNHIRSSKTKTEKTGNELLQEGEASSIGDLKGIKDTALKFATMVMNHFATQWSSVNSPKSERGSQVNRNSRKVYLDNLGNRQDGSNVGKPEPEARRGVIDWLARLIGVQGKTLGEFLREYQVHVLYDLAFTFFKWIFFLYAGLLIP